MKSFAGSRIVSTRTLETVLCNSCVSATTREIMSPARVEL